jgi:phosphoribosylformimino-5-aminoimidazole carboxamide ribotide isomerase
LHWLTTYGSDRIILGADFRDGKIAVTGWQEQSDLELFAFLKHYFDQGIRYTISTDVSKDGLLQGSALETYQSIREELPDLYLIASGGVTTMAELERLRDSGCYGAIVGKAIYEGKISLKELSEMTNFSSTN